MRRLGVLGLWTLLFVVACGSDGEVAQGGGPGAGAGGGSSGRASVEAGASSGGVGAASGGASGTSNDGGGAGSAGRDAGAGAAGSSNGGSGGNADSGTGATGGASGGGGTSGAGAGGLGGARDGGATGGRDAGAGGAPPGQTTTVDVLLVVDNSLSMGDKQQILRKTIPDLVQRLTDPTLGIQDLHVGAITSSLGSHGTSLCALDTSVAGEESNDDAHLLATRPRAAGLNLPSGFASWLRPAATDTLVAEVQGMVGAAGENGCGLEATLESAYRFLVDPKPWASIVLSACGAGQCAVPTGVDTEVLSQRRAFLRPDSAVAIVVISDENDCSIIDGGQNYLAANGNITLPKAATVCDQNPNDPCCYSCYAKPPSGCQADPACQGSPTWPASDDQVNLRCFEEKRRFGIDFLYPVERYINGFSRPTLCLSRLDADATKTCPPLAGDAGPSVVENPLFAVPAEGGRVRDPSMVYFLGIVGVPWQTIRLTKDSAGNPLPVDSLVYPTGTALSSIWPTVLGDPEASPPVKPTDPLMIESIAPRTGVTPGTGEPLAPPTAGYLANSVNGHEGAILAKDDLQHACIFALETPHSCTTDACDCYSLPAGDDNPVCQASDGSYGTTQYFAKGYPGLRELSVAKGLGDRAAVASICVKNLTDDTRRDFGYRPAVDALMVELDRSIR